MPCLLSAAIPADAARPTVFVMGTKGIAILLGGELPTAARRLCRDVLVRTGEAETIPTPALLRAAGKSLRDVEIGDACGAQDLAYAVTTPRGERGERESRCRA